MVYIKQNKSQGRENKEENMLTRITLDKMNERYAGVYYSPRPSELPAPEVVGIIPLAHKLSKEDIHCVCHNTGNK